MKNTTSIVLPIRERIRFQTKLSQFLKIDQFINILLVCDQIETQVKLHNFGLLRQSCDRFDSVVTQIDFLQFHTIAYPFDNLQKVERQIKCLEIDQSFQLFNFWNMVSHYIEVNNVLMSSCFCDVFDCSKATY